MSSDATVQLDMDALLNTPHVPGDAGEYAEGLSRILARIPRGWGRWIGTGRGWYPLLVALDEAIAAIDPTYEVHQVKEKYGTLRYYCSGDGRDAVHQLIRDAEAASAITCEQCGAPGRLGSRGGWWSTVCTEHEPEGFVVGESDNTVVDVVVQVSTPRGVTGSGEEGDVAE